MATPLNKAVLEELYARNTHRELARHDPLWFLYDYPELADREIVALVAALLAYGRVAQILKSVERVLEPMGTRPSAFVARATRASLRRAFGGFAHRFARAEDLCGLLVGVRGLIERHGSLERAFARGLGREDETVVPALGAFADELRAAGGGGMSHFLPSPSRGSACKRLHLFLRWVVRRDAVDPGGWDSVSASRLVVPLDVHMRRIGLALGLTSRRQADLRAAIEITEGYRQVSPDDPVRYDFALTRLGILGDRGIDAFIARCRG